ncbi:hypothetical protein PIB30_048663 [Stylosanthes scabra]|uniref:Sec-independent protein translocase protein TATA, chloroplastic n=1 Tax=Stylosanthes scabra TaxID=79078 RepID=A0ABU6YJI9_9FABA|nr:hypothetical protein [Stylosanthes scabra]
MPVITTLSVTNLSSSYSSTPIRPLPLPLSSFPSTLSFSNSHLFNKLHMVSIRRATNSYSKPLTCNALFGLGVPELVVIAGVTALVFGPKNLPQVGRNLGKTLKSFQQAADEFQSELKKEPDSTVEKATVVSEQQQQPQEGPGTEE